MQFPYKLPIVVALPQLLIAGSQSRAEEIQWNGFLGPERNGWVSYFKPPKMWPQSLKRKWQVKVGEGYGTPLIANGLVFQHAREGDSEVVWCLNLENGKMKWQQRYSAPFKIGGGGEYHGKGPKACPVYADGRLFTVSISGTMSGWDAASGKLLWTRNFDDQFGKSHPYWGATSSPIVAEDKVILHFGTDDEGALVALDVKSGEPVWSTSRDGASYSSPLVIELEGVKQVIQWTHNALLGVELSTGQRLWSHPFPHVGHNQNMPTPCVHEGNVLIGGENRGLYSLKPHRVNGKWVVRENWFQEQVAFDMSSAVMNGDRLFGMSHYKSGQLVCVDAASGKVVWSGPPRVGANVTFLSVQGAVLALRDNGVLQILAPSADQYKLIAEYETSNTASWAPPTLTEDGVLVKGAELLSLWMIR